MIYGKIINGQFVKAPTCINNDFNLTEEKYLSAGYLPVIEEDPTPPEGMELSYQEYVEENGKIIHKWVYQTPIKVPRVFSKLRVVEALTELGVWNEVKAWIEEQGLYDLYLAAVEFSEEDERFVTGVSTLKDKLGLTDEQVESILARCVK